MSRNLLWTICAVCILGALAIFFVVLPGRQSELARKGKRAYGTVQMKDSRPIHDGDMIYTVTLIWQDDQGKNHRREVQVFDQGVWDSLKAGQDIKNIYYMPSNPDLGSIPGAEDMTTPKAGALRFVAWSALLAGIICGYMAFMRPKDQPRPRGPVMTR